jgi:KDO2-lipid IV(A) lauroyltransferase
LAIRSFIGFLSLVPDWLGYFLCESLAQLVYLIDRKHRRIGMINLSIAFPEKDDRWKKEILRKSFQQVGAQAVEISRLSRMKPQDFQDVVDYDPENGLENYEVARSQRKGVIFLTAHISAWELLPSAHAVLGNPLSFVVRPLDNPFLDAWVTALRERFGNRVISKYGSIRSLFRILKEQGDIGILIDQNVQEKDGVYAPLFGYPACTTASAAVLALRTGAPVVPGFIIPRRKGEYLIRFYPPIKVRQSGDFQRSVVENTGLFNSYIERVIEVFPHCWLWGHRRFKTHSGGSDPYS